MLSFKKLSIKVGVFLNETYLRFFYLRGESRNMTAKEILAKVKAIFADQPAPPPPPAPADPEPAPQMVSYNVDGGQPVFVDISDDGIPDIDAGDPVWSDEAMTTPYPDGDYKVTGTDFGFSVAGGVVSAVSDPDGKGAGAPATGASVPDPVTADAPPAPNFEDRLKMLEDAVAQLVAAPKPAPVQYATEVALSEANAKIEKQDKVIAGLFELAEKLAETPTAEPVTLTGNKKDHFERKLKSEKKLEGIGAAISQLKNKN